MKIRLLVAEMFQEDVQTDRHDEGNSRISQFCGSTYKLIWAYMGGTSPGLMYHFIQAIL